MDPIHAILSGILGIIFGWVSMYWTMRVGARIWIMREVNRLRSIDEREREIFGVTKKKPRTMWD